MHATIINDCRDVNAAGRQCARVSSLLSCPSNFIGVLSDLEAAGNVIDVLDAYDGVEAVVLVNVAPRNKDAKRWKNGTPFCYFYHGKTLVVSTIDGLTLSLVKKLGLVNEVRLLDIPAVLEYAVAHNLIDAGLQDSITRTQFRSFEFVPRVAVWLRDGHTMPYTTVSINEIHDAPAAAWWVDCFGNVKTTLVVQDIRFEPGVTVDTKVGALSCYARLKDVPDGEAALIVGSSGLRNKRFLEVVVQGESAVDKLPFDNFNGCGSINNEFYAKCPNGIF